MLFLWHKLNICFPASLKQNDTCMLYATGRAKSPTGMRDNLGC